MLKTVGFSGDLRIAISGTGGEFMVMPKSLDHKIVKLRLADETLYLKTGVRELGVRSLFDQAE